MSAQHQIRKRPKDQSSDEDENEENKKKDFITSSPPSVPLNGVAVDDEQKQSVSVDIAVGDGVDIVDSAESKEAVSGGVELVDFSMFRSATTRCGGNSNSNSQGVVGGIVASCDALQRLGAALSAYSKIKSKDDDDEIEPEEPALSEFVGSDYRLQFLEDFNHFMAEHQDTEDIKS